MVHVLQLTWPKCCEERYRLHREMRWDVCTGPSAQIPAVQWLQGPVGDPA